VFATALDGCFGTEDAALKEPYAHRPDDRGFLAYSQKQINDFVKQANRLNLQVAMHAIGDAPSSRRSPPTKMPWPISPGRTIVM